MAHKKSKTKTTSNKSKYDEPNNTFLSVSDVKDFIKTAKLLGQADSPSDLDDGGLVVSGLRCDGIDQIFGIAGSDSSFAFRCHGIARYYTVDEILVEFNVGNSTAEIKIEKRPAGNERVTFTIGLIQLEFDALMAFIRNQHELFHVRCPEPYLVVYVSDFRAKGDELKGVVWSTALELNGGSFYSIKIGYDPAAKDLICGDA